MRNDRPSVYVAGPLGFAETTKHWYRDVLLSHGRLDGWEVFDPWTADPAIRAELDRAAAASGEEQIARYAEVNRVLGQRNVVAIDRCDAVLAILDGADVDSGTAAEVGYAAARGKPVVGLRTDLRRVGDNPAATVNLQVEHFIAASGGRLCGDLGEALDALDQLLGT